MKKCHVCGQEGVTGKHCSNCGTKLGEVQEGNEVKVQVEAQGEAQENKALETTKLISKEYGTFLLSNLKKPSNYLQNSSMFIHSIISLVLLSFIFGLGYFTYMKKLTSGTYFYDGPSVGTIFVSMIVLLLAFAISIGLLFGVGKLLGAKTNFKEVVVMYGSHITISMITALLAFLFILINSFSIGMFMLVLTFLIGLNIMPYYILSRILSTVNSKIDAFYGLIIYFVATFIVYSIIVSTIIDSLVGSMFNSLF